MTRILLSALSVIVSVQLHAATVTSVKDKRVVLDISGESFEVDQQLFLVNESGKRIAQVKVKQIRGNKALTEVIKGKAVVGANTQNENSGAAAPARSGNTKRMAKNENRSNTKSRIGGLAGLASNTMNLTAQYVSGATIRSEDVALKGTSFSLKGYFDYDYSSLFTFRGIAGLETFNVTGSTTGAALICGDGTTTGCKVGFNYLALEGHAQLNYLTGSTRAWVGLGYAFFFTMSKSINIPNLQAAGSTNQALLLGTGADFRVGSSSYIPVAFEYGYIPGENVKSSALYVRAGYGMDF